MKISIITVCYNSIDSIKQCVKSVLNQSTPDIEYIVIDGGSNDGTLEVLNSFKEKIDCLISEPDNGIYDAMNKGISYSTGDYIYFLNADDALIDIHVIEDVLGILNENYDIDFLYGELTRREQLEHPFYYERQGESIKLFYKSPQEILEFLITACLPHQASFAKKSLFLENKVGMFSESFTITGDFDWFVRMAEYPGIKISYTNRVIANFYMGGLSGEENIKERLKERFRALNQSKKLQTKEWLIKRASIYQNIISDPQKKWGLNRPTKKLPEKKKNEQTKKIINLKKTTRSKQQFSMTNEKKESIKYYDKDNYPYSIVIAGLGRCGTTLIYTSLIKSGLFKNYKFIDRFDKFSDYEKGSVYKTHDKPPKYLPKNVKLIWMFGNPMDIVVSVNKMINDWGKHHFYHLNLDTYEESDFVFNEDVLNMKEHFKEWYTEQNYPFLSVKFESLGKESTQQKMFDFLNFKFEFPKIKERKSNWKSSLHKEKLYNTYNELSTVVENSEDVKIWNCKETNSNHISQSKTKVGKNSEFTIFDKIYVINLPHDEDRRVHIRKEFKRVGIDSFTFFEATNADDDRVKNLYKEGKVAEYPPCFRCGRENCSCENNILIPNQIGNWVSFIRVWEDMIINNVDLAMVCEDDVQFVENPGKQIEIILNTNTLNEYNIDTNKPLLIRLSKSGGFPKGHDESMSSILTKEVYMSNPCFIINKAMAKILLDNVSKISHTSDVYIHNIAPNLYPDKIQAFSIEPLIATELSYDTENAKFYSNIHPKGIDESDKLRQQKHIKRVNTFEEYNEFLKKKKLDKLPKISIIIPSFNSEKYIESTIKSIINQKYPNLELIIIDGGSSDRTVEIIKRYEQYLTYWVSEKDNGMYYAVQKGFDKSTGEIMAWIGSDDMYHANSFFTLANIFTTFKHIKWIVGATTIFDENSRTVGAFNSRKFTHNTFLKGDFKWIQQESCFWHRDLWERAGKYVNTSLQLAGDLELWVRFSRYEELHITDALIGGFRSRSSNQLSLDRFDEYLSEAQKIIDLENELFKGKEVVDIKNYDKLRFDRLTQNFVCKKLEINKK